MLTTLRKGYYLGIDAGGSKTQVVISKESGYVLGTGESKGANPHNIPLKEGFNNINSAINQAINNVQEKHPEEVINTFEAACLGLAGYDTPDDKQEIIDYINQVPIQIRTFKSKKLIICNDGLIGFKSGTDKNFGVSLIASTGSNCYGVSMSGKEAKAGDWGYILGDQGSGYAMGQAILRQVMREYDGRSPLSNLTRRTLDFLKLKNASELVRWVYRGQVPVREIASLSQICSEVALSDSIEVLDIVNTSVRELIEAYKSINQRLSFPKDQELPVVLIGGLFSMKGQFADRVIRSILSYTPNANIVFPTHTPAEGAIKIALLHEQLNIFPDSIITFFNPNV